MSRTKNLWKYTGLPVLNRFVKAHGELVVTLLITAALLTSRPCPALAGPPRVFRVIYNQDCSHVFGQVAKQGRAIKPDDIHRMVDEVVDGGAELMLINPNGQIGRANYPSRVWQTYWDKRENIGGGLAQMKHLADGGHDYLALSLAKCRGRGIAAGVSVRMNDTHDTPWPDRPVHSDFWRAHPEWWIEAPYRPEGDYSIVRAMDYRRPEVREYFLALIREIVTDYSPDVLELDFMRFPLYFPPDVARECNDVMSGFVKEVRVLLGEDRLLYVRAPVTVASGLEYGLDYATWAREGLIDGVTVAAHFNTAWDIDMASWRRAVGERVALYACAESSAYSPDGGRNDVMGLDEKLLRGFAAANRAQGADGIYLFNFFCAREWTGRQPLFSAIGQLADPAGLEGKPKTYCLTAAAGTWHLPESDGPLQVPRTIGPRESQVFRLLMGTEPPGLPVDVEIVTAAAADPAKVRLHVNEQLAGEATAGEAAPGAANSLVFRATSDLLRSGSNALVVRNDGPPLTVRAVVARVRERPHSVPGGN